MSNKPPTQSDSISIRQFIFTLRQNPIYLREQGHWGEPNSIYANINRYSPFVIMGALVLGVCGGNNFLSTIGMNSGTEWLILLLCIPNAFMQMLTWGGLFMVPALTAPSVSEEIKRGTWEILMLTPQPVHHILFAKLFGSLSRLRIWWLLIIMSVLQGGVTIVAAATAASAFDAVSLATSLMLAIGLLLQPWLEIGYAALVGLTVSTWAQTSRAALITSYSIIFGTKLVIWLLSLLLISILTVGILDNESLFTVGFSFLRIFMYAGGIATCAAVLYRRSLSVETWSSK